MKTGKLLLFLAIWLDSGDSNLGKDLKWQLHISLGKGGFCLQNDWGFVKQLKSIKSMVNIAILARAVNYFFA